MNVLVNHCWCSDSNWGGHYNCRVIVSINRNETDYYSPITQDWKNIVDEDEKNDIIRFKPDVIEWLKKNFADRRWAIGTDEYNNRSRISISVFFQSTKDAMKFIKQWSSHKRPVNYFNYFRDIRFKLNEKTGRLSRVKNTTD